MPQVTEEHAIDDLNAKHHDNDQWDKTWAVTERLVRYSQMNFKVTL